MSFVHPVVRAWMPLHAPAASAPSAAIDASALRLRKIIRESLGQLFEVAPGLFEHVGVLIGIHADAVRAERVRGDRPDRKPADDSGLLVIEQREHFGMVLGNQERASPELGAPVFEPVDQLGHAEHRGLYLIRTWHARFVGIPSVELWFDLSCPYAYLASRRASSLGLPVDWRPMLLGGVFRGIGAGAGPMATLSPQKAAHNLRDMHRWAERFDAPFAMPTAHPMRTVRALRTLLGVPRPLWPAAIEALFAAYWQRSEDVTSDAVIAAALRDAAIPAAAITAALAGADSDAIKDELRQRTDEAIGLGIFGAPAWVFRRPGAEGAGEPILVWGQDRFPWLEAIARGWEPDIAPPPGGPRPFAITAPAPAAGGAPAHTLDVYVDIASPFAYLALTQLPAFERAARVRIIPILLGALFRDIGTPDVPLFSMPAAKLRYVTVEMQRWARWWGVPFATPLKFPQRTITAQRLLVLATEESSAVAIALGIALGRAMWAERRDVADPETLRAILVAQGLPPDWIERTAEPATKAALAANTEAARQRGAFGVPTYVVDDHLLFWGQDRLDLVARALTGWVPVNERQA